MKIDKDIIIPLIGIIIIVVFLTANSIRTTNESKEELIQKEMYKKRSQISVSIEECISSLTQDIVNEVDINHKEAFDELINQRFNDECLEFEDLKKEGYLVEFYEPTISTEIILQKHIDISVNMPMIITKEKYSDELNNFRYSLALDNRVTLELDEESKIKGDQEIVSGDGNSVLIVPAGSTVTFDDLPVENIQQIIVPIKKEEVLGTVMYDIKPDGLHFSRPAKLIINYDTNQIPEGVKEEDLKIIYCINDICESIPSIVDTGMKIVSAQITHTTLFGISFEEDATVEQSSND